MYTEIHGETYIKLFSPPALVHPESQSLGFLSMTQCEALSCIEVTRGEYLLVFNLLAVYVDASGRKSREKEIMYPAIPTAVGKILRVIFGVAVHVSLLCREQDPYYLN